MTTLNDARTQMLAAGMPPFPPGHPVVGAGRILRYGPKKRAWYVLHEFRARSGAYVVVGGYGCWGRIDASTISVDWQAMPADERAEIERKRREAEARERAKRERLAALAASRGRLQYEAAGEAGECPYLARKGLMLKPPLRVFTDGTLVVPLYAPAGEMAGVQKIAPDGAKRFSGGLAKLGASCPLLPCAAPRVVALCEGVATGLSIADVLPDGVALYVAFDAGNLLPVARELRAKFPGVHLAVFADDDFATEGNPGVTKARAVVADVGNASMLAPVFGAARDVKWTDFNDLHLARGRG